MRQPYQIVVTNYQGYVLKTYLASTRADAEQAAAGLRKGGYRHVGRVEIIPPPPVRVPR